MKDLCGVKKPPINLQFKGANVVVCTDLSAKELHKQVGVGRVVTSGNLGDIMVSILAQIASDMGLRAAALAVAMPNFITAMTVLLVANMYE